MTALTLRRVLWAALIVLSYGKHRALEISLAMTTEPELVLLDEPTAGMSRVR